MTAPPRLGIDFGQAILVPSPDSEDFDRVAIAAGLRVYLPDVAAHFRKHGGYAMIVVGFEPGKGQRQLDGVAAFARALPTGLLEAPMVYADGGIEEIAATQRLTHFISASVDHLRALDDLVPVRVLFGPQEDAALAWVADRRSAGEVVLHAPDWNVAAQQLKWPEQYLPPPEWT